MNKSLKAMYDFIESDEGKKAMEEFVIELNRKHEKLELQLESLHYNLTYFNDYKTGLKNLVNKIIAENEAKIEYCDKHHNGYELITEGQYKGNLCEINPTPSFYLLFEYFQKYGKDVGEFFYEDFLSEVYELEDYVIKLYQGQGAFFRLCLIDEEILIQI